MEKELNFKISYQPLRVELVKRDLNINTLETRRGGILNEAVVSKLRNDRPVSIESLAKICVYLDLPIERVVKISKK